MRYGALLLVAACYSAPALKTGSPCDQGPCPAGLVCSPKTLTCELSAEEANPVEDAAEMVYLDAPPDAPEFPANDLPQNPLDVTAGGTFVANLNNAHDDAPQNSCGGDGGADVFYTVNLPGAEVLYFDTFGSNFATTIRVFPGKQCTDVAQAMMPCSHTACGGAQSQLALQLPSGVSCIVVDQTAGEMNGALTLTVKRGGRVGAHLNAGMQTLTGNTCDGSDTSSAPDDCDASVGAKDLSYYFTTCPGQTLKLDASTCADPTMVNFDTVVYLKPLGKPHLACNDDGDGCVARPDRPDHPDGSIISASTNGTNLYWLTVDGYGAACGNYQIVTNLR
ncbi:MAG: hypothetical protein QM831_17870 [Kofleriaceae bacterium]